MASWEPLTPQTFRVHPQYMLLAAGMAVVTLYMAFTYSQSRESEQLVMAVICGVLTFWHGQWPGSFVTCDVQNLTLHRWGRAEVSLQWHQVCRLSIAGRMTRSVLVEYGDPASPESLLLPKLKGQEALLAGVSFPHQPALTMEDD